MADSKTLPGWENGGGGRVGVVLRDGSIPSRGIRERLP
jgi:hypothetical protein